MTVSMGGDMYTVEFVLLLSAFVIVSATFLFCFMQLLNIIERLNNYIMAQKDITAFQSSLPIVKNKVTVTDKSKKQIKDYLDYMDLVNKGVCDEKDEERFGTVTVDQG